MPEAKLIIREYSKRWALLQLKLVSEGDVESFLNKLQDSRIFPFETKAWIEYEAKTRGNRLADYILDRQRRKK